MSRTMGHLGMKASLDPSPLGSPEPPKRHPAAAPASRAPASRRTSAARRPAGPVDPRGPEPKIRGSIDR